MDLKLSKLGKTWLIDVDGTLLKHNGYKNGGDILLNGVKEFFDKIPNDDVVILLTARSSDVREITERFLDDNKIRYNKMIFDLPMGERILINDNKPSGLCMGYAVNKERDTILSLDIIIDENL